MESLETLALPEDQLLGNGTHHLANGIAVMAPPIERTVELPVPLLPEPEAALPPTQVFALGRLSVQFPMLAMEKEFLHAASQLDMNGKSDLEARYTVLS